MQQIGHARIVSHSLNVVVACDVSTGFDPRYVIVAEQLVVQLLGTGNIASVPQRTGSHG